MLFPREKQNSKGSGGHNKELILLTPDTFKMLTMKSKTHIAQQVRYYYVTLEKLVEIYKDEIIKNQDNKIKALERNLKKIKYPVKGALYILDISNDNDGYKIGKTKNMNNRIKSYNTAHKDNPAVVYVFYTHDIHRLEKCVRNALKDFEYRNNKEYYKASKEDIIDAMKDCQYLITKFTNSSKASKLSRPKSETNDAKDIVFTTNIEYINNTQKGGAENKNYINMYNQYKYVQPI